MVKLKAVLTATVIYECPEHYDDCETIAELCKHEQEAMRNDPTDFIDVPGVKFQAKVERVKEPGD
jgi:hypothetical protein